MILKKKIFTLLFIVLCLNIYAQKRKNSDLKNILQKILSNKKADVGISVIGPDNDIISINDDKLYPMLSTVKFPIALTISDQIEKRRIINEAKDFH